VPEVTENFFSHTGGTSSNLLEGNHAVYFGDDGVHGTHDFTTVFRSRFDGQAYNLYNGNDYLPPIQVGSGSRFENIVGNVLGTKGLASSYENGNNPIYALGLLSMRGGLGVALYDHHHRDLALLGQRRQLSRRRTVDRLRGPERARRVERVPAKDRYRERRNENVLGHARPRSLPERHDHSG
jgi:hypothetical protein